MNWPAPTLEPPAPPSGTASAPGDAHVPPPEANTAPDTETPEERRRLSAVPAAAWVALLGGTLVMVAAAIVVASNWDSIGQGLRFAGLALATAGLVAVAERMRPVVPTTAGIIAHVGAFLAAPIGIAGMSLFGYTWPTCLLIGGVAAVIATEVQARRWQRTTLHIGQVGAIAIAATGLAALTSTTAGLVASIVAGGLLSVGAHRRAAGLSLLAVLSPTLTALADAGIGAGTLERAGLVGDELSWSGPVVGVLAAMIIGIVAQQRQNNGLMLAAVAAPVVGIVTGLAAVDGSAIAWLSVPALVIVAGELGWWMLPTDRFRSTIGSVIDAFAGFLVAGALLGPWIVSEIELSVPDVSNPWAIPSVVTTFALALVTYRWRAADREVADIALAASLAGALATVVALDAPTMLVGAAAVVATGLGAFLSRRLHPVAVYVPAFWAAVAITDIGPSLSTSNLVVAAVLLVGLVTVISLSRVRLAADAGWFGWIEMALVVSAVSIIATEFVDGHGPAAALVGAAAALLAIVAVERRFDTLSIIMAGVVGLIALDAATSSGALEPTFWIGWTAVTAALAAIWQMTGSQRAAYATTAAAVIALATSAAAVPISAEEFIGLTMVAVALLTGLSFTVQRRTPLDGAAIAAGVVLLATATFDVRADLVSAIWLVLGLQVWTFGLVSRRSLVQIGGTVITMLATGSWWFTSGLNAWAMELIEPADIRAGDLWMLAATAVALLAGWTVRAAWNVNSWLAYSAGLTIAGLWLTSVQIERDTVWAIPLALTIGIVAVAVGAWRRLAAPLVGGTVLTLVTVFIASGSDLRAIPTWSWLAVGGLALLGVAILIERTGKQGSAGLRELVDRWD